MRGETCTVLHVVLFAEKASKTNQWCNGLRAIREWRSGGLWYSNRKRESKRGGIIEIEIPSERRWVCLFRAGEQTHHFPSYNVEGPEMGPTMERQWRMRISA